MKYIKKFDSIEDLLNFKRRAFFTDSGTTYALSANGYFEFYTIPANNGEFIVLDTNTNLNDDILLEAIYSNKLLSSTFNYNVTDKFLSNVDLASIKDLKSVFSSKINNKQLISNLYEITDFSCLKYFTGLTDISGIKDNLYLNLFGASKLEKVNLPDSLKEIGNSAFAFCLSLSDITISNSVETICSKAFYSCISLCEITIPASVKTIERYAFNKCNNLKKIVFNSHTPIQISSDMFNGVNQDFEIYVPKKSYDLYLESWPKLAEHIKQS